MTTADKIRRFLEKGVSATEIAAKLGVKVQRVYNVKSKDRKRAEKEKPKTPRKAVLKLAKIKADPKAEAWLKQNRWFGEDKEKTAKALELHDLLVQEGVDPKSDKYWDRIDIGMMDRDVLERKKKKEDIVNHPPHYTTGGIDFLDYAEAKGLTENAYLFNVVKYVSRAGKKTDTDPLIDLKKAEFYLKREIANRQRA